MKWEIENTGEFVRVTTLGLYSFQDVAVLFDEIPSLESVRPGLKILFDTRQLDCSGLDFHGIQAAEAYYTAMDARIYKLRAALLVKSVSNFGRGRQIMFVYNGKITGRIRVFLDEGDALYWLANKIEKSEELS
jgi:hypothetical protein